MATSRGHHEPESSIFSIEDFVQDSPTASPDAAVFADDADDFTWFQDAIEQESEDIAAWGSQEASDEPFVWFQEATIKPVSHFRPEIEGLRAVSVLMIVIYHVWLGRVSGGVDVFLFISAFLLGSSFARRLDAKKPFDPVRYWLRTFTRLMPPAVFAILGTLAGTWLILPQSEWQNVISQAIASATYVQNIWLSITAVDYYALDASTASPLQHFWSLSLQGQVFITWPLLFIAASVFAKRSARPRVVALVFFVSIALASLGFSVWFTAENQSAAYFSTPARAWEVAAGTVLALALPWIDKKLGAHRPGSGVEPRFITARAIAGWAGFALLVSLGIVLDVQGLFPGWIALWPLTGAALIIVAGYSGSKWGFDRVLTLKAPRALAASSYSLYLVHWPILIMWLAYSKQPRAGLLDGLCVIAISMIVAYLLSKAVDSQFRSASWKSAPAWRSLTVIGTCLALVLAASLGWRAYLNTQGTSDPISSTSTGGQSQLEAKFDPETLTPKGFELDGQWPTLPYDCAGQEGAPELIPDIPCQSLHPLGTPKKTTVLVLGSSHSRQYIPTLLDLAKKNDWQIVNYSMNGCPFRADSVLTPGEFCYGYFERSKRAIDVIKPDIVVTTATAADADSNGETVLDGTTEAIQYLLDQGVDVYAFRDAPRWPTNVYACAERATNEGGDPGAADASCGGAVTQKLAAENPAASLSTLTSDTGANVTMIDLTDQICPDGRCAPIIGNTYVYMDDNHLSRAFTSALAKEVTARIEEPTPAG